MSESEVYGSIEGHTVMTGVSTGVRPESSLENADGSMAIDGDQLIQLS